MFLPRIRSVQILFLILFTISLTPTSALSQSTTPIWTNGYHKKLGRVDSKGIICDDSSIQTFGRKIGRIKDGVIYDSPHGGMPVGRLDKDGKIWDRSVGGKAVGRWEDGKVYNRSDRGGKVLGVSKNENGAAYFLLKEKINNK